MNAVNEVIQALATVLGTLTALFLAMVAFFTALGQHHEKTRAWIRVSARWILRKTPAPVEPAEPLKEISPDSFQPGTIYIPQDNDPRNAEEKFYNHFCERLSKAKHSIYNCGDGFSMRRERLPEIEFASSAVKADILDGAIIAAMQRGATYSRFQVTSVCSISWMSRLIWMKQKFEEQFRLYFNSSFDHMGTFCAIDPREPDCVYEWQLVSRRPGMDGTFTRGYGFLGGNSAICREINQLFVELSAADGTNLLEGELRGGTEMTVERLEKLQIEMWNQRVIEACDKPNSRLPSDIMDVMKKRQLTRESITKDNKDRMAFCREDFLPLPYPTPGTVLYHTPWLPREYLAMNNQFYFSFGSNMDRDQMKERTPKAEYVGVGHVPDHDLVFNRKGTYRPGGVASIVPANGIRAYGVVWAISHDELAEMDRIEDPSAYQRVLKTIITEDGKELVCNVYVAFPQGNIPADQPYLEIIIKAAETAKLPLDWIDRIKKYRLIEARLVAR